VKAGSVIGKRYVLERRIGRGGSAVTWRAADREAGTTVVVKILTLGALEGWKGYELFERETGVLRNLHHDGIPAYVDSFKSGTGPKTVFVLVQEHVEGINLQEKVASGWRGTEEEICAIAERLLEAVRYIHSLRPPLIHRDINPRNVIVRDDGAVFLVDFGGVQDALRVSSSGSQTVIGTPGYMPMEQFVGRATVRSDLYACAATTLFMLTHKDPQGLPVKDMKIDVPSTIDISPGLAAVLDSWLEPDEAKRTLSVEAAIRYLQGGLPEEVAAYSSGHQPRANDEDAAVIEEDDTSGPVDLQPPRFSRIKAEKDGDVVTLVIPERGAAGAAPFIGGFSVFWLAFVAFWTFLTMRMGAWGMSLFSIPFWLVGLYLARGALNGIFGKTLLCFDPVKGFSIEHRLLRRKIVRVPAADVHALSLTGMGKVNGRPLTGLQLEIGARRFTFGEGLSAGEKKWVKRNVNGLLRTMMNRDQNIAAL
jgi:eukaryotic-like serine/threonine-protein kinase